MRVPVAVAIICLFLTALALLLPRLGNHVEWHHPPGIYFLDAHMIGRALYEYQHVNGRLPNRLSELVPDYIQCTNIQLFFWPPKPWTVTNSSKVLAEGVDNNGIFVYLGDKGFRENILMYERTNLWLERRNVFILTTNFTPEALSTADIQARLSQVNRGTS